MYRIAFALLLLASGAAAQEAPLPAPDTTQIYLVVGEPPAPVGGMAALTERVVYPPEAAEAGAQGRVYVEMVVERDGSPSDLVCVRAPSPPLCAAALAAVAATPFTPGRLQGTAVRTRHVVPVDFRLPDPPEASGGAQIQNETIEETSPELIGGIPGLSRRLEYPESARREGIQGRVLVQFVIDEQGLTSNLTCVQSPDDRLCEAAREAIGASQFRPGTQRGRPVKVRFTLPVDFRLSGSPGASGAEPEDGAPRLVYGVEELMRQIQYPTVEGYAGRVVAEFTVGADGRVRDLSCTAAPHPTLCDAALDAISVSAWTPGTDEDGQPVDRRVTMPIDFLNL